LQSKYAKQQEILLGMNTNLNIWKIEIKLPDGSASINLKSFNKLTKSVQENYQIKIFAIEPRSSRMSG
jgi:hypothetical protein